MHDPTTTPLSVSPFPDPADHLPEYFLLSLTAAGHSSTWLYRRLQDIRYRIARELRYRTLHVYRLSGREYVHVVECPQIRCDICAAVVHWYHGSRILLGEFHEHSIGRCKDCSGVHGKITA